MAGVSVRWKGFDDLIALFGRYSDQVPKNVSSTYSQVGTGAKSALDSFTPVRTGHLRSRNQLTKATYGFELSNNAEYVRYVNYGTRYQSANPFFDRAVMWARQELDRRLPKAMDIK